jgi:hypothetical protein
MTFFLSEGPAPQSQGPRLNLPRSEHAEIAATLATGACATVVLSALVLTQFARGPSPTVPSLTVFTIAVSVAALSAASFAYLRFQSYPRTLPGKITHRDALACLAAALFHPAPAGVTIAFAISAAARGGLGAPPNSLGFGLFSIAAPAFVFGLPASWLARLWVRHRREIPAGADLEVEAMGFALTAQIVSIAFLALVLVATSIPASD